MNTLWSISLSTFRFTVESRWHFPQYTPCPQVQRVQWALFHIVQGQTMDFWASPRLSADSFDPLVNSQHGSQSHHLEMDIRGWTRETLRSWGLCPACHWDSSGGSWSCCKKEFKERWDMQLSSVSGKVNLSESMLPPAGEHKGKLGLGLYIIYWQFLTKGGICITWGEDFLGTEFLTFSPLPDQGLQPSLSWACLVWFGFLWLCFGYCYPDRFLTSPIADPDFPLPCLLTSSSLLTPN